MNGFIYDEQTAKKIILVKRLKRANDFEAKDENEKILSDTQTAIDNINECINSVELLQNIYDGFQKADVSFLDKILGLNERGLNGSHYRDYLSLDEKNIIEVRISDHYETKNTALSKSNNKVQYLYQIVLVQQIPKPESHDAIKINQKVGNVHVLTQGIVGTDYNKEVLKTMLKTIADYLSYPDYLWADKISENKEINNKIFKNKNNVCKKMNRYNDYLLESKIRRIVRSVLNETLEPFTIPDKSEMSAFGWMANTLSNLCQSINNEAKSRAKRGCNKAEIEYFKNVYNEISKIYDKYCEKVPYEDE